MYHSHFFEKNIIVVAGLQELVAAETCGWRSGERTLDLDVRFFPQWDEY